MTDKDGKFSYSPVITVNMQNNVPSGAVTLYPAVTGNSQLLHVQVVSSKAQTVVIRFHDANGRLVTRSSRSLVAGTNYFTLTPAAALPAGLIYVNFSGEGIQQTITHLIQNR